MEPPAPRVDFGFAFNDAVFSDRVLRIEVIVNSLDSKEGHTPNRKSRGKDLDKERRESVVREKTLPVNSLILAAHSLHFRELFKSETRESQKRDVPLKISVSEYETFMKVLQFVYGDTPSATSPDLLGMLRVAIKYKFTYCKSYCSLSLQKNEKKPMPLESALSYLELPESGEVGKEVQPLIDAAKAFIVERYSDFNKSRKEVMDFPVCAVEVFLGSGGLHVDSEDDVVDFVLEWATRHYPKLEERQVILTKRLVPCICFSCLSHSKLNEVLTLVGAVTSANHDSLGRVYKLRHIDVVQLKFSQPRCVVHFDLKREECESLSKSSPLDSRPFCLGGRRFYLSARFSKEKKSFGLFLIMTKESGSCTLYYEYAVIKKSSKEFQNKSKGDFEFNHSKSGPNNPICRECPNLFGIKWTDFIKKDSKYFVDGILHLRADLTIKK